MCCLVGAAQPRSRGINLRGRHRAKGMHDGLLSSGDTCADWPWMLGFSNTLTMQWRDSPSIATGSQMGYMPQAMAQKRMANAKPSKIMSAKDKLRLIRSGNLHPAKPSAGRVSHANSNTKHN
eukprot:4489310-Amphidinium_carterae.1